MSARRPLGSERPNVHGVSYRNGDYILD
jgi:hypothetical protein